MLVSDILKFNSPLDSIATFDKGIVTLIYGPPAVGKTNVAMSALSSAEHPAFIDTEGGFSATRAEQLGLDLESILYKRVSDFKTQHKILTKLKQKSDLLVVDSLIMLYRLELRSNPDKINSMLARQMSALSKYALDNDAAVLVTGQVYKEFDTKNIQISGGDILKYWPKTIIELSHDGEKKLATLHKHRNMKRETVEYSIESAGLTSKKSFMSTNLTHHLRISSLFS